MHPGEWMCLLVRSWTFMVSLGWVETDMGLTIKNWWATHNPDLRPITVQQSVEDVLTVIAQARPQAKIPLYNHTGEKLSW